MLHQIEPEKIICYNTPFPEMEGDIVYVDHEQSSCKYMSYERSIRQQDLEAYKIGGQQTKPYDKLSVYMDVPSIKGGSAYGGKWRPFKPEDYRFDWGTW